MPNDFGRPYKVVYSERHRQALRRYGARAAAHGLKAEYLAAVKAMDARLATDPQTWGDPTNNLPHLGLVLYHAMQAPLHVFYAAHSVKKIVFVRDIRPLPNQGLDDRA